VRSAFESLAREKENAMTTTTALDATALAILANADDYDCGNIGFDTFDRRARMLWESVHRSDHDAVVAALARLAKASPRPSSSPTTEERKPA
jgi:hypothetical protein